MKFLRKPSYAPLLLAGLTLPWMLQGCAVTLAAAGAATAAGVTAAFMSDRRSNDAKFKDGTLVSNIKESLNKDPLVGPDSQIQVDSYNYWVLLTGFAQNDVMRLRAAELALSAEGVRKVFNEIRLPTPVDDATEKDFATTSAVRTALLTKGGDLALNIHVTTDQGTVYLMGLVTREEAAEGIDIVRRVDGVAKVVPLFEYVRLMVLDPEPDMTNAE